jgi:hypothetical protein
MEIDEQDREDREIDRALLRVSSNVLGLPYGTPQTFPITSRRQETHMFMQSMQDQSPSQSSIVPIRSSGRLLLAAGLFLLLMPGSLPAGAQTPAGAVPQSYLGMSINKPNTASQPAGAYGILRIWDSGNQWPQVNPANGTYDFGDDSSQGLDWELKQAYTANDQMVGFYTLSRTPQWASSNQTTTICNYDAAGAHGECYPPSDLNADGSGTDAHWKNWVTKLANHLNGKDGNSGFLGNHIHVKYYEIWNEFDRPACPTCTKNVSWAGTYAQLVRLAEDARCIIMGSSAIHTIHNAGAGGAGTNATCSAAGIDPSAQIAMPSGHDNTSSFNDVLNFLYCSGGATTGAPDYCNLAAAGDSRAGADAIDIVNFHMKPGNENVHPDPEQEMTDQWNDIEGTKLGLESQEKSPTKPLWNGESGYSGNGWAPSGGDVSLSGNTPGQVAFIGRYALIQWSLGIQNSSWYQLDLSNILNGTDQTAYQQVYDWMTNATMTSSCTEIGTAWTCGLSADNGYVASAVWDTSYTCSSSGCTTEASYTAPTNMHFYRDLAGNETNIPSNHVLTNVIGLQPILLENEKYSNR